MKKIQPIAVLLASTHPLFNAGVASMLAMEKQIKVLPAARSEGDAIISSKKLLPDIIVIDTVMVKPHGLLTAEAIKRVSPKTKIVVMCDILDAETIKGMIAFGAIGCIKKDSTDAMIADALIRVQRGEHFFTADVAQLFFEEYIRTGGSVAPAPKRISERERQVLSLVVLGASNKEAADTLHISVRTIEKHRQRIMKKLGVHKATELVRFAITKGLVKA